ncbi:hypothetical protein HDU98_010878 [Podochytrium sp. JEL0797]|nr:hypothetical protein HDU98_010878 [Podochytrium sp. JEL0797]
MSSRDQESSTHFLQVDKTETTITTPVSTKLSRWLKLTLCVSLAVNLASVTSVITVLRQSTTERESPASPSNPAADFKNSTSEIDDYVSVAGAAISPPPISTNGTCGTASNNQICAGSKFGNCCSASGSCGYTTAFAAQGVNLASGCAGCLSIRTPSRRMGRAESSRMGK